MILNQSLQKANQPIFLRRQQALELINTVTSKRRKDSQSATLTYLEFIQQVLEKYQGKQPNIDNNNQFTIFQDLKLMHMLSSHKKINSKLFEFFAKNRGFKKDAKYLQKRYKQVLLYIGQKQIKTILKHVCQIGIQGYHIRKQNEEIVLRQNQCQLPQEEQIKQIVKIVKQPSKIVLHFDSMFQQNNKTQQNDQIYSSDLVEIIPIKPSHEIQSIQKIDRMDIQNEVIQICKIQKIQTSLKQHQIKQLKQLEEILMFYSQYLHIDIVQALINLDSLSGNLVDLDYYYQKKDQRLKWNEQQDQALIQDNDDVLIFLIRQRGRDNICQRKKYLLSK